MERTYSVDGKAVRLETIRKMTDEELLKLLGDIHTDGYCEGYDDGYLNAREDCW